MTEPLKATTTFEVFCEDPLSSDRLLRRLEVLRRQLMVRWCGFGGAFTGYDSLEVSPRIAHAKGIVQLDASLLPTPGPSVVVEMSARGTSAEAPGSVDAVLVRGSGRALLLR
jgi:hypothetical protein